MRVLNAMVDTLSPEKRSWNMSRIKGSDTGPERLVRSILHKLGYRFRLGRKDLPGKPDIVLPKYRTVVFVHGCFWHRHEGCKYAYMPKSRIEFWKKKFERNVQRDSEVKEALDKMNWHVLYVWECEVKDENALALRLDSEIRSLQCKSHGRNVPVAEY